MVLKEMAGETFCIRFNHKYISNMTGYKKYVREAEFHQYAKKKKVNMFFNVKFPRL